MRNAGVIKSCPLIKLFQTRQSKKPLKETACFPNLVPDAEVNGTDTNTQVLRYTCVTWKRNCKLSNLSKQSSGTYF